MRFTKAMEYGMIILTHLGHKNNERVSAREITNSEQLPHAFTQRILQELLRAGLVDSRRGVSGGYTLSKDPKDITLYEIHDVLEGEIDLKSFFGERVDEGVHEKSEALYTGMEKLHDVVVNEFEHMTLADFM